MVAREIAVFVMSPDEDLRCSLDDLPGIRVEGYAAEAPLSLKPPGGDDIRAWVLDERACGSRSPEVFQSLWEKAPVAALYMHKRPASSFPCFTWPEQKKELMAWVEDSLEGSMDSAPRIRAIQGDSCVMAIAGPAGGVGKTFLATNLGAGLASVRRGEVLLIDLDLYLSRVPAALNMEPGGGIIQLLPYLDDLSWPVWERNTVVHRPSSLAVLCAPCSPEMAELVDGRQLGNLLAFARGHYKSVILDLPSGLGAEILWDALTQADESLVITRTDPVSVRATRSFLDVCQKMNLQWNSYRLVLNCLGSQPLVPRREIRGYLELEEIGSLRLDPEQACQAQISGQALLPGGTSGLAQDLERLAESLWPGSFGGPRRGRNGLLDLAGLWKRLAR